MRSRRFAALVTTATAALLLTPGAAVAADTTRSVAGVVETVAVDPGPGADHDHPDRFLTYVRAGSRLIPIPPGSLDGAESGRPAAVELNASGRVVAARVTGSARQARAAASPIGAHKLTVLPVFWTSPDTAGQSSLTTLANQAKSYWSEQSNGGIDISVDVRDWKQIAAPSGACDTSAIWSAALAAHATASPAGLKEHVAVYFPRQSGCSWAGLGSVNGSMIWINGYQLEDVLTHEFGHNLGLGHANKATCTASGARVPLSGSCTIAQYEDTTDVMGYALSGFASGNLNAAFSDYLGLGQTVTTTPATLSALSSHSGTSGLKIPVAAGTVFVDYRPATGRDVRAPRWAGVQVRLRTATNPPATQLLDMQPGTATAFTAANLPVNGVWAIPDTKQVLKVTAAGASTATVEIVTAADTTAPTVAPVLATPPAAVNTATVPVSWTAAADKDSGISAYRVAVNGTVRAEVAGTALTADVPLTEGTNSLVVTAVNASGLTKAGTAKTVVRDSTAPAAVTNLKVSIDGRTVTWTAPADTGTARSFAVRADGTLLTTVKGPSATVAVPTGRRTVSVTPSDAAGNVGTATETTLWIDPAAPVAPVVTAPVNNAWQKSRQVDVAWTAASAPGSGIASYTVAVNGKTSTVAGDVTSATVTVPNDGTFTVTMVAKSLSGVLSRAATATVKVDTIAPPAPAAVKLAADQSKLTWSAASGGGSPVSWLVRVDDGDPVTVTKPEVTNTAEPGRRTWTLTPVDAAGNVGTPVTYTAWTDRTAPATPVITSPAADGLARTAPVTVTWDAASDDESGIASYLVTVGTQKTTVRGTSHTYRPVDGRQTVTVAAVNNAGVASVPASVAFTYDQTAPTAAADVRISAGTLTWRAATDRTTGVAEYVLALDGTRVTTVTAPATTAEVTTPAGRHVWTVTAVDKAGNSGPAASTAAIWFDTTAPVAARPAALPATQTGRSIRVSWAAASDTESGIRGYTVVATNGSRTVRVSAAGTATSAGVSLPEDGTWRVTVQAVNQAGLTTDADAGAVVVDSAKPGAPVITSPVARDTTGTSFTVAWTAPAAGLSGISGYRVAVNGRVVAATTGALQAAVTLPVTKSTPATMTVTAVSGAGVAGTAATLSFTVSPAA